MDSAKDVFEPFAREHSGQSLNDRREIWVWISSEQKKQQSRTKTTVATLSVKDKYSICSEVHHMNGGGKDL